MNAQATTPRSPPIPQPRPWLALVALLVSLCTTLAPAADRAKITVSAAASLREVMKQLAVSYAHDAGVDVEINLGASGALAAQIDAGAPVDVFISAADDVLDGLARKARIDPATRRVVARNAVVLIVPQTGKAADIVKSFKDLANPAVKRVALGLPRSVPAGAYAVEVLQNAGAWDAVKPKAVYGANVRQVLDYVSRGEADAGIVYATDALEAGNKVTVVQVAPESSHKPVVYPAVVVKGGDEPAGKKFIDFMLSQPARKLFEARGFIVAGADNPQAKDQRPRGEGGGRRG